MTRPAHIAGGLLAGLLFFAAPTAWVVFQQSVGAASYLACNGAGPPWGAVAGAVAVLACAAAALGCWRARNEGSATHRFLMIVGAGSGTIFAIAALTMTVAILLIPACAR